MSNHLISTYNRIPVSFVRGEGAWLWDTDGNRYLDAISGIAVCSLGHAHPKITRVIRDQAGKLLHTSNLYRIQHQEELAERLASLTGMSHMFFGNSGAEANEAAIKIARRFGHNKGLESPKTIVMDKSFHGRTIATLSASGNPTIQKGFEPLLEGFLQVPFNDIEAIEQVARQRQDIAAILVEPIQGEGGVHLPSEDYLGQLRQLCDDHNWLMMLDEIQTGIGRSGRFCAYQHASILPDVCTLAKALGNGIPIAACLTTEQVASVLSPGSHGSTFGGNPFACQVALTVVDTLQEEGLIENARLKGSFILEKLRAELNDINEINAIRGLGLMVGINMYRPCAELVTIALNHGLLINVTAGDTIRLLPPLILTDDEADQLVETLCSCIRQWCNTYS